MWGLTKMMIQLLHNYNVMPAKISSLTTGAAPGRGRTAEDRLIGRVSFPLPPKWN